MMNQFDIGIWDKIARMKKLLLLFPLFSIIACVNNNQDGKEKLLPKTTKIQDTTPDTIGLEQFLAENVIPILSFDTNKLKRIIHFPLEGSWSIDMGFSQTEEQVSASDFFAHYEQLFDQICLKKLRELDYNDVQTYIGDGYTQLIVSNGWELPYIDKNGKERHREGGIILQFKRFQGQWKLFYIESMK
jgi:hypothetical protein